MAISTYAGMVEAIASVEIATVIRRYSAPPDSLNSADMPASFPRTPSGDEGPMTYQAQGGWPTMRAELVVCYEAVAQDAGEPNFAGTVALMDAIASALRAITPGTVGRGPVSWTLRQEIVSVAGIGYWAVIAAITAHG